VRRLLLALLLLGACSAGPAPERRFQGAERLLAERFGLWRQRVERATRRLADAARESGTGPIALFGTAERILREEQVDGVAVLDWKNRARFWAGRTFDADPEYDFFDVKNGIEMVNVIDHPAHRVLYAARPAGDEIAVAYFVFDERFPRSFDLLADIAHESRLDEIRLRFGGRTVPVRAAAGDPRPRGVAVIDGLVHATFLAPAEEGEGARGRGIGRALLAAAAGALAIFAYRRLGRRLPREDARRALLALALIAGFRGLLSALGVPDLPHFNVRSHAHPLWAGPGDVLLTAAALLLLSLRVARCARDEVGRRTLPPLAAAAVAGAHFLPAGLVALIGRIVDRTDGVVLFDPLRVLPDPPAAMLLAALCLATASLFVLAHAASRWARRLHPLLGLLPFFAIALGLLPWHGALLGTAAALGSLALGSTTSRGEKAATLAFLAAIASFPPLYGAERGVFVRDVASRARDLVARSAGREADDLLAAAVQAARDPAQGIDSQVAAAIASGDATQHLAFLLWSAARWTADEPCAVQVWDFSGTLLSAFDFDSPPAGWLPAPPAGPSEGSFLLAGRDAGAAIRFHARDFVLRNIGDDRAVGVARFLVPDRWDLLLTELRPSMFSEPHDLLVRSASPPLLMAELDRTGAPRRTSAGTIGDFESPDGALVEEANRRGRASARLSFGGREARIVLVAAPLQTMVALIFAESLVQQGGFAFAKVLLTDSAVCLLFVLALATARRGRFAVLFRHRVSLFLAVLSVPPVMLLAFYNYRAAEQRHESEIKERLERRLNLAEALLRGHDGPIDNEWCTAFASDHRMDLNVYRGQELVATSRPGVWDTGLLGRRLAAPPFVAIEFRAKSRHAGREFFAQAGGLLAAYRRYQAPGRDPVILAAPALDDRRALERRAAESNALLVAVFLMAATLTVFVALFLSRSLTRPLHALQSATRRITEGEFHATIPEGRGDEFGELIRAFNRMTRGLQEAQDLRARAERAAAWREMARQIAHDIKNPLTPIKLTIQNLLAAYREEPEMFQAEFERGSNLILQQIDALYRIAGDFSAYARMPARTPRPLTVAPMLEEVVGLYAASDGAAVRAEETGADLVLNADRDEMRRALINLVTNGRQAGARHVVLRAQAQGRHVRLEIEDDGTGIPPEILGRIFEPSFTTKTSGTGLGMPIVKRIVDDHDGTIKIDSVVGRGTKVILLLPSHARPL